MRVTVDTTQAKSFDLVEPGPYEMTIKSISEPKAPKDDPKGDKGVEVEFAFQDPQLDQASGTVQRRYPIEGKGAGFFRDFWKAATGEDIPVGTKLDVDLDNAIGRPVIVGITHRPWQGKTYNNAETVTAAV